MQVDTLGKGQDGHVQQATYNQVKCGREVDQMMNELLLKKGRLKLFTIHLHKYAV